jgi:hypothetical protein
LRCLGITINDGVEGIDCQSESTFSLSAVQQANVTHCPHRSESGLRLWSGRVIRRLPRLDEWFGRSRGAAHQRVDKHLAHAVNVLANRPAGTGLVSLTQDGDDVCM